ncbi:hypothetical protein wcw_0367 [Waddlia chondrophila WSU 86-1044]|uniref:YchJ-like middle NTF2-like domain-containing protein n=1 Tax=Waddlia chondrophila (strain ATCC VR-1470 / WSU 86-1044) TaxID=716544 RepID=D6YUC9_WADCW|nr:hypothetical protein wcw_0367 [Waddlia chondrophila WSU 86-1044]
MKDVAIPCIKGNPQPTLEYLCAPDTPPTHSTFPITSLKQPTPITLPINPIRKNGQKNYRPSPFIRNSLDWKFSPSQKKKNEAFVTFKATLSQNGQDISFTEKSRFLKKNNQWLYASGIVSINSRL